MRNRNIRIHIWDTPGKNDLSKIKKYLKDIACAIFVYDILDEESFTSIKKLIEDYKKYLPKTVIMILVGNKFDLEEKRKVDTSEGQEFSIKYDIHFYETSANYGININEIFEKVSYEITTKIEQGFYDFDNNNSLGIKIFINPKNEDTDNINETQNNTKINEIQSENKLNLAEINIMELIKSNEMYTNRIRQQEELLKEVKIIELQLNQKITELQKTIIEKEHLIKDLNKQINKLNETIIIQQNEYCNIDDKNKIIKLMEENKKLVNEIKEIKSTSPIELIPGEKFINIILKSSDENILYPILCKNTDKFKKIEDIFYDKFPDYQNKENYFIVNNNNIQKNKNLEDNNINNNDIITITQK